MIDEFHPDAIEAVLHRHHVGRLACIVAGEPYLVPITYTYQDGVVYGHSMLGQKLDAMRSEPRVAFEVDERWEDRYLAQRGGAWCLRGADRCDEAAGPCGAPRSVPGCHAGYRRWRVLSHQS